MAIPAQRPARSRLFVMVAACFSFGGHAAPVFPACRRRRGPRPAANREELSAPRSGRRIHDASVPHAVPAYGGKGDDVEFSPDGMFAAVSLRARLYAAGRESTHTVNVWRSTQEAARTDVVAVGEADPGSGASHDYKWSRDARALLIYGTGVLCPDRIGGSCASFTCRRRFSWTESSRAAEGRFTVSGHSSHDRSQQRTSVASAGKRTNGIDGLGSGLQPSHR